MSASSEKFWTPMRIASTVVVLAICAVIGVTLFSSGSTEKVADNNTAQNVNTLQTANKNQPQSQQQQQGSQLPTRLEDLPEMPDAALGAKIEDINGKNFRLSDYKGKVVLINLWATWCGPCRSEIPELIKIREEFAGQDFEVVGLNISPNMDDLDSIRKFVEEMKIPYTTAQVDMELASVLMSGNGSIPQSYLITRDGKIYRRFIGYGRSVPQKLRQAIQEALNLK